MLLYRTTYTLFLTPKFVIKTTCTVFYDGINCVSKTTCTQFLKPHTVYYKSIYTAGHVHNYSMLYKLSYFYYRLTIPQIRLVTFYRTYDHFSGSLGGPYGLVVCGILHT